MRKSLLTSFAAISALGLSLGVAHAAPEPLPAKLDSVTLLAEEGPAPEEEAQSAFSAILARFMTIETKAEVTKTAAADPESAKSGCPKEAEKLSEADGASEDKDKKKQLVGPEPIYFAF